MNFAEHHTVMTLFHNQTLDTVLSVQFQKLQIVVMCACVCGFNLNRDESNHTMNTR